MCLPLLCIDVCCERKDCSPGEKSLLFRVDIFLEEPSFVAVLRTESYKDFFSLAKLSENLSIMSSRVNVDIATWRKLSANSTSCVIFSNG